MADSGLLAEVVTENERLKAEDVIRSWWSDRMLKGLADVIDKRWYSHENRHPTTGGEPHGWVSTYAGSGGARDIVFTWSGAKEKAIADYIVSLHNHYAPLAAPSETKGEDA